ncbi:Uncharacterised protein [Vibrio cholerae]|nr:Uncharacterised protein [Vibrio cholerae]
MQINTSSLAEANNWIMLWFNRFLRRPSPTKGVTAT